MIPFAVCGVQGVGDRQRAVDRLRGFERCPRQTLLDGLPVEQFHREIRRVAPDVEDGADVGMVERRSRARLALKSLERRRRCQPDIRQHLHGDVTLEPRIPSPIHLAHAARAERRNDLERAKARTRWDRH